MPIFKQKGVSNYSTKIKLPQESMRTSKYATDERRELKWEIHKARCLTINEFLDSQLNWRALGTNALVVEVGEVTRLTLVKRGLVTQCK